MCRVLPSIRVQLLVEELSTKIQFCYQGVAVPDSATSTSGPRAAVFVAGHLGELTWQIPVELVDAVLAETKTTQRRLRVLPSRVGI